MQTGELLQSDGCKKYGKDFRKYWKEIAGELQHFGGNSIANFCRGHGVSYREILEDVCHKLNVDYDVDASTAKVEAGLFSSVLQGAIERMTPDELAEFCRNMELPEAINVRQVIANALARFREGGADSYAMALAVANPVWNTVFGRSLSVAATAGLARGLGIISGPAGMMVMGVWAAVDMAGPAYRVTVPAVFQIALLRQHYSLLGRLRGAGRWAAGFVRACWNNAASFSKDCDKVGGCFAADKMLKDRCNRSLPEKKQDKLPR